MFNRLLLAPMLLTTVLCAQAVRNPGLDEMDKNTEFVIGWYTPPNVGWTTPKFQASGCHSGAGCVQLAPGPGERSNLMQNMDASPFAGKLVRMRGWVRTERTGRAQMWLRIDLPERKMGFFDNMQERPVMGATEWTPVEITGAVAAEATNIAFGIMAFEGPVWFDDVSIEIIGDAPKTAPIEPARPLTELGLRNLTTFAELYGLIRYYHPSDEVANTNMDRIAIEALPAIEAAETSQSLAEALRVAFAPVAPTLRIWADGTKPPAVSDGLKASPAAKDVIAWKHHGVGLTKPSLYSSSREKSPVTPETTLEVFDHAFAESAVKVAIPVRLFTDTNGATIPRATAQLGPALEYSAASRTTRLADIIIAWNVMRHFYPYFDVVKTDWNAVLPAALRRAATDQDEMAFEKTLQWTVAQLHDGHGNAFYMGGAPSQRMFAPFLVDWIEEKVVITRVSTPDSTGLKPGDEIVSLNGRPVAEVLANLEQNISGATPQWIRAKSLGQYFCVGNKDTAGTVEVRPLGQKQTKTVEFRYAFPYQPLTDARPAEIITELKPGIWYVDLTRGTDKQFDAALPDLTKAKGIVFDMRGYPKVSPAWFQHVTETPLKSAQWHVADSTRPNEHNFSRRGEWDLQPKAPYLSARKVFLTHGGAISYAESTMGIVEHYRLGEIFGAPTAGTNGNINTLTLPGKYRIIFTGMKVLKHDGTQHHGIGIRPTISVSRTQSGVAAGKDEVLDKAVESLDK